MFGFLVKKAFFDMWDNLFRILFMNVGYIAVLGILYLAVAATAVPALSLAFALLFIVIFSVYTGGVSGTCADIANYGHPGFADFWKHTREALGTSLLFALFLFVYGIVVAVALRFYTGPVEGLLRGLLILPAAASAPAALPGIAGYAAIVLVSQDAGQGSQSAIGIVGGALLFWVTLTVLLAVTFALPLLSQMDRKVRKVARKSLLLFFDNPLFSIGMSLASLLVILASGLTALLLPGLAAQVLFWNVAFKLRLYKYDWLEKNPGENRRRIPWDALLLDDRERVGKRTLRGMIFPWKE